MKSLGSFVLMVSVLFLVGCSALTNAVYDYKYHELWQNVGPLDSAPPSGGHLYSLLLKESNYVRALDAEMGVPDYIKYEKEYFKVDLVYVSKNKCIRIDYIRGDSTRSDLADLAKSIQQSGDADDNRLPSVLLTQIHNIDLRNKEQERIDAANKLNLYFEKLRTDPVLVYNEYVSKAGFVVYNGKMTSATLAHGKVSQIVSPNRVLVYATNIFWPNENVLISVICNTSNLVDNQDVGLILIRTGSYKYINVLGAQKTIPELTKFDESITLGDFTKLWGSKQSEVFSVVDSIIASVKNDFTFSLWLSSVKNTPSPF